MNMSHTIDTSAIEIPGSSTTSTAPPTHQTISGNLGVFSIVYKQICTLSLFVFCKKNV